MPLSAQELAELKELPPNAELLAPGGEALSFYASPGHSPASALVRRYVAELVPRYGGKVAKKWSPGVISLVAPDEPVAAVAPSAGATVYDVTFLVESVRASELLELDAYVHRNPKQKAAAGSPRQRSSFSAEVDAAIREHMGKSAGKGETTAMKELAKRLEDEQRLEGHTWQSLRERYRKVLKPQMQSEVASAAAIEALIDEGEAAAQPMPKAKAGSKRRQRDDEEEEAAARKQGKRAAAAAAEPADAEEASRRSGEEDGRGESAEEGQGEGAGEEEEEAAEDTELVHEWVARLARDGRVHPHVAWHALVAHSGSVRDARNYILRSVSRERERNRWTSKDDRTLLSHDVGRIEELTHRHGAAAVQARIAWINGQA